MNKQDLLAGKLFDYNGNGLHLMGQLICIWYEDTHLYDHTGERFAQVLGEPGPDHFFFWKKNYGTCRVYYTECTLIKTGKK